MSYTLFNSLLSACISSLIFTSSANAIELITCDKNPTVLSQQFANNWINQPGFWWASFAEEMMSNKRFDGGMTTNSGLEPKDKNPHLSFLHIDVFKTHGMTLLRCHYRIRNNEIKDRGDDLIMSASSTEECKVLVYDTVVCN